MPFPTRENATYHKWLCATEQLQQIIKVKPFFRLSLFKSFSKLCAVKAYAVISLSALLCTQASAQKNNFSIDRRNNPLKDFSVTINKESHPFFVDIDGDGDYDCFSGEGSTGAILYYKNVGTATEPVFQKQSAANNPLSMVKFLASGIANPAFADLDGDGDYDCLVVDEDGNENYFKNTGTSKEPAFVHVANSEDPFSALTSSYKGTYSPSFYDWNKDGLTDLFVNTTYYKNVGTVGRPEFVVSSESQPFFQNRPKAEFTFTPLRWVDINKDGAVDVFQGNSNGSFVYQTLSSSSNAIVA